MGTEISHEVSRAGVAHDVSIDTPATTGWTATATVGAAVGVMSASALARRRARPEMSNQVEAGTSSSVVSTPVGKGGFVGATNGETIAVVSRCPKTGRAHNKCVQAQPWLPALAPRLQSTALAGSAGTCSAAGSAVQTSPLTSSLSTWAPCLQRLQ